ncbi:MAG: beta family protein [Pseudomonas sp.]|uniref:beta family protein n=1 Tax=Stenotrophomonas sp. TaxID=69392 RepID=UPI003D6D3B2B
MDSIAGKHYVPILRTRDAEIKGFSELSGAVKDFVLPVIEFTKSRRTKKNVDGAVAVCVDKIEAALAGRAYIADVTSMESLTNPEIEKLLDPSGGFRAWRGFVLAQLDSLSIPVVHLTDPLDPKSISLQCNAFLNRHRLVAIRVPHNYEEVESLAGILREQLGTLDRVVFITDGGYVQKASYHDVQIGCSSSLSVAGHGFAARVVASSGFPSSVVLPDYGGDAYGKFGLLEVSLSSVTQSEPGMHDILHGDYALVHPADFVGVVTNWVPRVDVPLSGELYYHRYRRNAGGYEKAAFMAYNDADYSALPCWGDHNIASAADGKVLGKSPAHWIAVRVNFHITRQAVRLGLTDLGG